MFLRFIHKGLGKIPSVNFPTRCDLKGTSKYDEGRSEVHHKIIRNKNTLHETKLSERKSQIKFHFRFWSENHQVLKMKFVVPKRSCHFQTFYFLTFFHLLIPS